MMAQECKSNRSAKRLKQILLYVIYMNIEHTGIYPSFINKTLVLNEIEYQKCY